MNKIIFTLLILLIFQVSCKEKEVDPFIVMNSKIEESNSIYDLKIETLLQSITIKADQNDHLFIQLEKAKKVESISKTLVNYIEDLKTVIKSKNSKEYINELFFNNGQLTFEAKELLNYIEIYKYGIISTLNSNYPEITAIINNTFDIGTIEDRRGNETNWLTLNFKNFSPNSIVTKLSSLQSDINRIETNYLSSLLNINMKDAPKHPGLVKNMDSKPNPNKARLIIENTDESIAKNNTVDIKPKVKTTLKTHTVQKGETVYRISKKYGITIAKLKKFNGMTNNNLVVGQKIRVQ
ncbi:MAG: LysM peptidoglycan-binding domain-containing protein [Flavobacteriaceae bacterium]